MRPPQLPERFRLEYTTEDGSQKRPVMIHRAIMGSIERMMAILMEHTGGRWPFWLSPRQIMVCSVNEAVREYATHVHRVLQEEEGFFADLDVSDNRLPKKIRAATQMRYNLVVVIGEQERLAGTVTVRRRGPVEQEKEDKQQPQTTCSIADFVALCRRLQQRVEPEA